MIKDVKLKVVGVNFKNDDGTSRQDIIGRLTQKAEITLLREPSNKYDKYAIMVLADGKQIGYIGKEYAKIISPMMDAGSLAIASISEIDEYKGTNYCHLLVSVI